MKVSTKKVLLHTAVLGMAFGVVSCSDDDEDPVLSGPPPVTVVDITDETVDLVGPMRGTLREGQTYFLKGDLVIPEGEEIVVEPGVTIIAEGDGGPIGPEITVNGAFIAEGTQNAPILMSVPEDQRTEANIFAGLWGGIQCSDAAKAVLLRWVRMEYMGGEGGPGTPRAGSIRYGLWTLSDQTEVVIEDCYIYGVKDDFYRPVGGKLNIMRNVFEFCGQDGGDVINVKGGTVGNVAYNVSIGGATNAFKPSDDGSSTIQSNMGIYNNTILNSGFRRAGLGRGANINFENGARGFAHNNIIVNCKRGIRMVEDADLANIDYDWNWYYGTHPEIVAEFIPSDGASTLEDQPNTVMGGPGENNPMFVNYDPDQFSMADYDAGLDQPRAMNTMENHDLRLANGSPAIGAGVTSFSPVTVNYTYLVGNRAPDVMQPNADMGAYPSNGGGNNY